MNRALRTFLVVAVGCVACDDGGSGGPDASATQTDAGGAGDMSVGVGPFEEQLTAVIDGEPFAAQLVLGDLNEGLLTFQSDQSQERQLFFTLPGTVVPGEYALTADGDYIAEYAELFVGRLPSQSGIVVVDYIDRERREISGTFAFVGEMESLGEITRVEVTEGRFSVEYNEF